VHKRWPCALSDTTNLECKENGFVNAAADTNLKCIKGGFAHGQLQQEVLGLRREHGRCLKHHMLLLTEQVRIQGPAVKKFKMKNKIIS